jgi:K+ transporter
VASEAGSINRIPEMIFSYLNRNAVHEERHYGMPTDQIVEIGTQIDLLITFSAGPLSARRR